MDAVNTELKQGDSLLIQVVAQFPCLYNKEMKEYRNTNSREAAWISISKIMNMLPTDCSKRWGQLRESFSREKRRRDDESKSGSGLSQRRGFSLFDDMKFLERHYQKRGGLTNVSKMQSTKLVRPLNTGSIVNSESIPLNATEDMEWRQRYIAACLTTPLTPPPDLTSAAMCQPVLTPISYEEVIIPSLSLVVTAANTTAASTIATLTLSLPVTATTPAESPMQTIPSCVSSPAMSTLPPPITTPTPPRTPTPIHYSTPPSTSMNASTNMTHEPISLSSFETIPTWPTDDELSITSDWSAIDIPQSCTDVSPPISYISRQPKLNTTSTPVRRSHCSTEPMTCYNKKIEKPKKSDAVESSFLRLSSVIENHLTKRMKVQENVEQKVVTPRSDEAFMNLVVAELADCDEATRVAKKAKILKVLYEK